MFKSKTPFALAIVLIIALVLVGIVLFGGDDKESNQTVATTGDQSAAVTLSTGEITPNQYQDAFLKAQAKHLLLDVRTPEEFASGHIEGAVNISVETLSSHLNEVPTDQPVVVYCRSGNRSAQAAQILNGAGYSQVYDLGGIIDWQAQGFPVVQ